MQEEDHSDDSLKEASLMRNYLVIHIRSLSAEAY